MLKMIKWPIKNVWGALFILIRTLGALAMQKLIAILYGPAGTTLFSHFQNFISLFTQPVQDVVAQGLINGYTNSTYSRKNLYKTAVASLIIIFSATSIILWLTNSFPTHLFNFTANNWGFVMIAILILCLQSIATAILIAQRKLKVLSFLHLVQWLLLIILIYYLNDLILNTLQYYLYTLALFTLLFYAVIIKELRHFGLFNYSLDSKVIHHFKQFLWMGLAVWISSKWVDFFIREYAIQLFGPSETGLWQAVARISEAYRGLFISFLLITLYPVVSKLFNNSLDSIKSYLKKQRAPFAIFTLLFFVIIYLFRSEILLILYSSDYLAASSLFELQIAGDFIAFISFPFAVVLMATIQTKAYVICEIVSAAVYTLCIYWGSDLGIKILVIAHIIRFIFYFILVLLFTRKALKFA